VTPSGARWARWARDARLITDGPARRCHAGRDLSPHPDFTRRAPVTEPTADTKRCSRCGESKPVSEFNRDSTRLDSRRSECKLCQREMNRRADPEIRRQRDRALKRRKTPKRQLWHTLWFMHRMRPEDWEAMWTAQDGRCYLCGDGLPAERAQVNLDHDHACCPPRTSCPWCRRGMTCGPCNRIIAAAREDPERLRRIATNLEQVLPLAALSIASKSAVPEKLPPRKNRDTSGRFAIWDGTSSSEMAAHLDINRGTVIRVLGTDGESEG